MHSPQVIRSIVILTSLAMVGTALWSLNNSGYAQEPTPFAKSFLTAEDLPGMKLREDHRDARQPPDDETFKTLGGVDYGLTVWIPEEKGMGKIDRMVEIHFVFPDAESAENYLRKGIMHLAEGLPQIKDAPQLGDQSLVVGGLQTNPFLPDVKYYSYIFLYRVDRTLVKLYAYQDGDERKLQPLGVFPIAKQIADRIAAK